MDKINSDKFWSIILAAGKGKRMQATIQNKVTYKVKGIPMISRTIDIIKNTGIKNIVVVVGFAKNSVLRLLDSDIKNIEQKKRLGTGHAVKIALRKIPEEAEDVLVLYGDDSFLYSPGIIKKMFSLHKKTKSQLTFLTISVDDPTGLGRIIRDKKGKVIGIVEEKDATEEQKKIKEINSACYIFSYLFLRKYINKIPKSEVTGEYYLPGLVSLAIINSQKLQTFKLDNLNWRGVNTPEELKQAESLMVV
ncbi:hypothetical protein C4577_03870 [Candidatus Parcubacteria bacterium]|nr:MAG: hypothetical protein C4577_03870 [Candidatus Parcubacteria bacterium]